MAAPRVFRTARGSKLRNAAPISEYPRLPCDDLVEIEREIEI